MTLVSLRVKYSQFYIEVKGKGKAIPLQAWTGHEGSRRWRLPDFKTIGTSRLYPQETFLVLISVSG